MPERRRKIQQEYNEAHGITPTTIKKAVRDLIAISKAANDKGDKIKKGYANFLPYAKSTTGFSFRSSSNALSIAQALSGLTIDKSAVQGWSGVKAVSYTHLG